VHNMRSIDPDLLRHILRPRLLQEIGAFYKDDVSPGCPLAAWPAPAAAACPPLRSLTPAPRPAPQDVRRRMWPEQARSPAFIDHLKRQYDYKQLEAIEVRRGGGGGGGGGGGLAPPPPHPTPLGC
jgi:hypothetical protein